MNDGEHFNGEASIDSISQHHTIHPYPPFSHQLLSYSCPSSGSRITDERGRGDEGRRKANNSNYRLILFPFDYVTMIFHSLVKIVFIKA